MARGGRPCPYEITAAKPNPELLDLPWSMPLAVGPRGGARRPPQGHLGIVRFVRLGDRVMAVKEINAEIGAREYAMLRMLERLGLPCVEALGVVTGRVDADGEPLDACLLTRHLKFSLPYRALFS